MYKKYFISTFKVIQLKLTLKFVHTKRLCFNLYRYLIRETRPILREGVFSLLKVPVEALTLSAPIHILIKRGSQLYLTYPNLNKHQQHNLIKQVVCVLPSIGGIQPINKRIRKKRFYIMYCAISCLMLDLRLLKIIWGIQTLRRKATLYPT